MKNPPPNLRNLQVDYHLHKHHLPTGFRHEAEKFLDFCNFYYHIFQPCSHQLIPQLNQLMHRHYPATTTATHPIQLQYIKDTNEGHLFGLFTALRNLLHEQTQDINIHEKYPKLETWKKFYCNPSQPDTLGDNLRNIHLFPDDEDWKQHQSEENRKLKILHDWHEKRKNEYYDLVQPFLFEYLPQLHNLEPDYWVLYAVTIRDNYEEWTTSIEYLETSIQYHLPPDSITWDYPDFKQCLRQQRPLYSNEVQQNHNKMIFG